MIINSVIAQGGIQPSGTKSITANGVYDVTDFASADVQVPTTAPAHYLEFHEGLTQTGMSLSRRLASTTTLNLNGITTVEDYAFFGLYANVTYSGTAQMLMSGITTIGNHGCAYMFSPSSGGSYHSFDLSSLTVIKAYGCENMFAVNTMITSIDVSSLQTISEQFACQYMFNGCVNLTSVDLSSLTTISGNSACSYMFSGCSDVSIDLSSLTTISGGTACQYMFFNSRVTSLSLPSLTTISGTYACQYMFNYQTYLTSISMPLLATVAQSAFIRAFYGCTGLTSISLPSLTTAGPGAFSAAFQNCTSLISAYLPRLISDSYASRPTPVFQVAFSGCTSFTTFDGRYIQSCGDYGLLDDMLEGTTALTTVNVNALEHIGKEGARAFVSMSSGSSSTLTDIYFPMLTTFGTNPFYNNAFKGRNGLTIHFRKDAQATVEALQNYSTLWGAGTGSTAVFDLAGTLTGADGNDYARSEINSVYASETAGAAKTATAWSYNNTIYYTSGGAEPSVGDTIYSDSACTQAVTTISSIA